MIWSDIPGWTCPRLLELYDELAATLQPGQIFVEVGVAYGKSLAYMATKAAPGVQIIGVDSWLVKMGRNTHDVWRQVSGPGDALTWTESFLAGACFAENDLEDDARHDRIELCRGNSPDVARALDFEVDAVFLDGSHEYAAVKRDIESWRYRLKPGGILAGHDINDHYPGVEQAVREMLPGYEKRAAVEAGGWGGVWTWRKP